MTAKKRILFIQTQAENAGAQEISRLLGEGLAARGNHVEHVFFYRKSDTFNAPDNTTIICDERPGNPFAFLGFLKKLHEKIRKVEPDIVFTFQHFGNVIGAPMSRLAGRKIIANQVSARETINPVLRYFDLFWGATGLYSKITVNSYDLMRDYSAFPNIYTNRLIHVPHGFDFKSSDLTKAEARARFSLPPDKPLIGTVARLNEAKQIDAAVKLLRHNPALHLAIAGQGPDEERLRAVSKDLAVDDRVHFLGEMAPTDIGDALAAFDVFVFPSRAETFGLAAVEAGQAGVPLVVNDIPVLREVLEVDGEPCASFVDVRDENAFIKAVDRLLTDEDFRTAQTRRGRRLGEKYSLSAMVDAYEAMAVGDPVSVQAVVTS